MRRRVGFVTNELYHVYNRGVRKSDIFLDSNDYQRWETLLSWCSKYDYSYSIYLNRLDSMKLRGRDTSILSSSIEDKYKYISPLVNVHAYVEMPNHFHLVLEQNSEGGISKYMQKLSTAYALYFNQRHGFSGSLYESNFLSKHVGTQEQFVQLLLYILRNPVEANLVGKSKPFYRWSSALEYTGEKSSGIISTNYIPESLRNQKGLKAFVLQL